MNYRHEVLTAKAIDVLTAKGISDSDIADVATLVWHIKRTSTLREQGYCPASIVAEDCQYGTLRVKTLVERYAANLRSLIGGVVSYVMSGRTTSGNGPFGHYGANTPATYAPATLYFSRQYRHSENSREIG